MRLGHEGDRWLGAGEGPGGGLPEPCQNLEEGGLAGAVGPHQGGGGSGLEVDPDGVQGPTSTPYDRDVTQPDPRAVSAVTLIHDENHSR